MATNIGEGGGAAAAHTTSPIMEQDALAVAALARDECNKFCGMFTDVPPIGRSEVAADPDKFVLIDCRTDAETAVSVIEGAMLQRDFERLDPLTSDELKGKTLVPYCTIGYRSGVYAQRLQRALGPRGVTVRNGEGVLMWLHDGGNVVSRSKTGGGGGHGQGGGAGGAGGGSESDATSGNVVRRVHTYGKPWDFAPPDVDTVQFGSIGMALHGLAFKLGGVFGGRW